jgi:16S rRNA C1402 (ribose-2'-O) methylase RsmI
MKKMSKYEKLTEDLKKALEATQYIETDESISDTGTCNFDDAGIFLNRWHEEKVNEAARLAGSYAVKHEDLSKAFHKTYFTFGFPSHNQGNRRSARAEAICKILEELGYEVYLYQAMD